MAKDPAFLFYPGDWQGGTSTFSRFLKGCYMDVLIAQFNSGHLSLEEIRTVLGSDFGQSWPALQKKFVTDESGLFFNERLDTEITRRRKYSKSRSENRMGRKDMKNISKTHDPTYVKHMENENENEIEDWNIWGTSILKKEDAGWEKIRGREISAEELKEFLSVAVRRNWKMQTQQQFRVALNGFKSLSPDKSQSKTRYKIQ